VDELEELGGARLDPAREHVVSIELRGLALRHDVEQMRRDPQGGKGGEPIQHASVPP
jgi:hypothetical protein